MWASCGLQGRRPWLHAAHCQWQGRRAVGDSSAGWRPPDAVAELVELADQLQADGANSPWAAARPGRWRGGGRDTCTQEALAQCWRSHGRNVRRLGIAATVAVAGCLLGLAGPTGLGGPAGRTDGLRHHGDYTDLRTATGAKGRRAQQEQDIALALAKSDPKGESARRAQVDLDLFMH